MSSSPQDQNQEPKEEMKAEETEEEKRDNAEETREEKKEEKEEKKEDKKEKEESWGDFIYNPRTGEFLGRTASSWGKTIRSRWIRAGTELCVWLIRNGV